MAQVTYAELKPHFCCFKNNSIASYYCWLSHVKETLVNCVIASIYIVFPNKRLTAENQFFRDLIDDIY